MKLIATCCRVMAVVALIFGTMMGAQRVLGQATVSATPSALTFGIPTGSPGGLSTEEAVTVTVAGTGTVTFGVPAIVPGGASTGVFASTGNTCVGTLTAPATCQVSITLTTTATSLQTATLTIPNSASSLVVALSGAYGAIKLFDPTTVANSIIGAGFATPYTIVSSGLNLSCTAPPTTAKLSGTPDGLGYLLVDNYLLLSISGAPVGSGSPAGNVCSGGVTDGFNSLTQQDCFSGAYRSAVPGIEGDNSDVLTNPGNSVLVGEAAGGVPPIDVSAFFPPAGSSVVPASISATDAGGFVASSSLFLVTSCSLAGVAPGGQVTGNPITPGNPASQTQTATFNSAPNQNISLTTSVAKVPGLIPSGTVQRTTDIAIPQQLFSQLVSGTSAAPSVCVRLSGETDTFGNAMCKGFLVECSLNGSAFSGSNCVPIAATQRSLLDLAKFSSPDEPVDGTNFLTNKSCTFYQGSGTCAPTDLTKGTIIGPGMLLGSDNWTCAPGSSNSVPCTPQNADTHTPATNTVYSSANCSLTAPIAGNLCPLDSLTQFEGASDGSYSGTLPAKNSIYVPVVNMPKPFTQTSVSGQNANGWINGSTINAAFTSNGATYPGTGTTPASAGTVPASNNFTPAAPYSMTYGLAPASAALPDTTFPVAGDLANYNAGTNPNVQSPFCTIGALSGNTPLTFTSNASFVSQADGIYNLHYFTTDCALTEELLFNPSDTTTPTANWASFRYVTVGVDTVAPAIQNVTMIGPVLFLNQPVTLSYECDDSTPPGSGVHTCDTSLTNNVPAATTTPIPTGPAKFTGSKAIATNIPVPATPGKSISVTAQDFAGNTTTSPTQAYSVQYETPAVSCGPSSSTSPSRIFLAPVGADATATVKKGKSVPYAFRLCDYKGVSIGASGPVITNIAVQMFGDNGGDTAEDIADAIEDTDFHWNASCQYWIYNLRTSDKERGVKYVYTLTLNDGTTLTFTLKVK